MTVYKRAILPKGFCANGVSSGIKRPGKLDLAAFYSYIPAKAACLSTSNKIKAAPIKVNKKHLKLSKGFHAIIANSGNANAFTGSKGIKDADETARILADAIGVKKEAVLVASTGIINKRLPLLKIKNAIPELTAGLSADGIDKAKKAILTTDTFAKEITVKFDIGSCLVTLCGIAKGAGMIAPDMATLLSFILTDASISQGALKKALKLCVDNSFNCITVDGCMSTNDTVILMANAAAENKLIDVNSKEFNLFVKALNTVCLQLAKMVVRDAEGASKFIRIRVDKAKNFTEAKKAALYIANSNLFKTAIYGENPNFGRIASAVGASGIDTEEENLIIKVSPLNKKDINVDVSVNRGAASAVIYTSDLTPEYIKINAEYN